MPAAPHDAPTAPPSPVVPFLRGVIAVSAGLVTGAIGIMVLEILGHMVVPPPAGIAMADPAALRAAMPGFPVTYFVPVLLAYVVGPTIGAALAARLAPARPLAHAGVVAGAMALGALQNFRAIPHPAWFVGASFVAFALAPLAGVRLARRGGAKAGR